MGHVFNARGVPLRRDLLPAVRIFCDADTRTAANQAHALGWFIGDMQLKVQIVSEAPSDPTAADRSDQYCALVEAALLSDAAWLQLVPQVNGIETTVELDGEGEQRTVTATLDWSIRYQDCVQRDFPDDLKTILLELDFIDPPADPNTAGHPTEAPDGYPGGYPGPDGRVEVRVQLDLETAP